MIATVSSDLYKVGDVTDPSTNARLTDKLLFELRVLFSVAK